MAGHTKLRIFSMLARIGRTQEQIVREGYTQDDGHGANEFVGYYCTGSWCIEDRTDSHGECVNCGEPVVMVYEKASKP